MNTEDKIETNEFADASRALKYYGLATDKIIMSDAKQKETINNKRQLKNDDP